LTQAVRDYDSKLKEYRRIRQEIAKYIDVMARPFEDSGLTIREILGKSIGTNPSLAGLPPELLEQCKVPPSLLTVSGLTLLRQLGARIAEAHRDSADAEPHWKSTRLLNPERFTIEEACDLAARASRAFSGVANARDSLADANLGLQSATVVLSQINDQLEHAQKHCDTYGKNLLINLLRGKNAEAAQRFIERCDACHLQRGALARVVALKLDARCIELVGRAAETCERLNLSTIDTDTLGEELQNKRKFVETARSISAVLAPLIKTRPESGGWYLSDIAKAHALLKETGRDAVLSRNARTSQPDAAHLLQKLCSEGKQLQAQKAELAGKLSFAEEFSVEALSDAVSTIRVAGLFRMFSRRYHRAKRLFRSISRTPKYDKREAVNTLEALIGFRRSESQFNRDSHVTAAFGSHFRGIETEFERFERLARYYTGVETHFGPQGTGGVCEHSFGKRMSPSWGCYRRFRLSRWSLPMIPCRSTSRLRRVKSGTWKNR
jgi:hypothetical protein